MTSISSFAQLLESNITPLSFQPLGDNYVKLYTQDTAKYAGILMLRPIRQLQSMSTVQLKMTLISSDAPPDKKNDRIVKKASAKEYLVRIVVHGMKEEKKEIGNLLSEDGLFLQHPSLEECGQNVEYCNPHYLLRPGSQTPALEVSVDSAGTEDSTHSEELDEVNIARLAKIFDCADGGEAERSPTIATSPRLRSELME